MGCGILGRTARERGHRTLVVHRKGGKTVTIPLAPRTARAVELAIGERLEGPIFLDIHGQRLRREESVLVEVARRPEQQRGWCAAGQAGRHRQAHRPPQAQASFITAALDAGLPLRDVQEAAATPRLASGCGTRTRASLASSTPSTSRADHARPRGQHGTLVV